jgi:hypothetical protein
MYTPYSTGSYPNMSDTSERYRRQDLIEARTLNRPSNLGTVRLCQMSLRTCSLFIGQLLTDELFSASWLAP